MSGLDIAVLVGAIFVGIVLLALVTLIPLRRRTRRVRAELEASLPQGTLRMANAQGFGQLSRGKAQVRGNGWLALTADELVFGQWVPRRETRVARSAITAVETPRSWLGKTNGSRLLCVRWRDARGTEDAMAWYLRDRDAWVEDLNGSASPARAPSGG